MLTLLQIIIWVFCLDLLLLLFNGRYNLIERDPEEGYWAGKIYSYVIQL